MPDFNSMKELNIGLLLLLVLFNLMLLFGATIDQKRKRPFMRHYAYLLITNMVMLLAEAGINIFNGSGDDNALYLCLCLSYGAGAVLIAIYTYCLTGFIREHTKVTFLLAHIVGVICVAYEILVWISPFTGYLFTIGSDGCYQDGTLKILSLLMDPIMMLVVVILTLRYRKSLEVKGILYLVSISVLSIPTMLLWEVWYPVPEYAVSTFYFGLIFILFHGELEAQLLEKEKELNDMKINLMLSQIGPHFIYNTLNTIGALCTRNPKEAEATVNQFARYLRSNLNSLSAPELIPFEQELEHTKTYVSIEQKRFQEKLRVEYDTPETRFLIPALSLQPLVENAIRYGIRRKRGGGTVRIHTTVEDHGYLVVVEDDGAGFDVSTLPEDGKGHIGIWNVKNRLQTMCQGDLQITSTPGVGTKVVLSIPKE